MWSLPRLCLACLLAIPSILELPEFITEWDEKWQAMMALLDLWYVRLALLIAAGLLITYPQWAAAIKLRLQLPHELTLWGGLHFWYGTKKADWQIWRERRKQKRGGGE